MASPEQNPTVQASNGNPGRKKALAAVASVVVLGGIAYGAYWALVLNHFETTDNAYVAGNVVQVTPQIGGTVLAVQADDTDHVKAGQVLVKLDPADAKVALEQAEAQLAQTVREVRTLYANDRASQAQVALRSADLARAKADLSRIQDDVDRRQPLVATGAVGKEEFQHVSAQLTAARSTVAAAESALQAAKAQQGASRSLTDGTTAEEHPSVLRAAARVREATLAMQRTELVAPVEGFVARRNVQLGQRVPAGAPLMSVIALDQVWVEANFKESQLARLRLEQPVELTADVYGDKVTYHGVIEGLGAGTGAAFALLPAQNATGNWIKVVQRVPVRVRLDSRELAEHPLRVGLSMEAKVDVSRTDGRVLSEGSRPSSRMQTSVFERDAVAADARVNDIIARNLGMSPAKVAAALAHAAAVASPRAEAQKTGSATPLIPTTLAKAQ
ncbi:MAG: efflux RND transporter periplasmic adaptor subunit [Hydrogenophaga sp.]|nr:efflux RND transporter periplasmic adaptor subunit [Hydrogenophaga sp.]